MPVQRHRSPAIIATVLRSNLADAHHKEVDAVLKDLRLCSRRLKSALDCFEDEQRTLERLYYKSKNQHRTALFFKRVPEMRRYGRRLSELGILERVDLLRASFVGLKHASDQKALRSSWSHVPEKSHVYFLTERLAACSVLVCKMRERLERAYHHFTLAIQTGAFVQLIVLFVGISSRMSVLSSQLEEALQLGISTCRRLLVILHPPGRSAATSLPPLPQPETSTPSYVDCDAATEDTGQVVSRCEPIDTPTSVVEDFDMKLEATLETRGPPPSGHATNSGDRIIARVSKTGTAAEKSLRKKAKKKFDEIDEIFGF